MVEPERIRESKHVKPAKGRYVLYWMQASVRAEHNPALEHAIAVANRLGKPLVACFGLTDAYPEATRRHYQFLVEGLVAAETGLRRRKIKLVVRLGSPSDVALALASDACAIVTDVGYLRHQRRWRRSVEQGADLPVTAVEGDVVVPVDVASDKREYAARTIRPKLARHLDTFLRPLATERLRRGSLELSVDGEALDASILAKLSLDDDVPSGRFEGGTFQARAALTRFIEGKLARYVEDRNQPQRDTVSHLGMYLNYGQISPVAVAMAVRDSGAEKQQIESFLEELIVRRELAINFVAYEPDYDKFSALPEWARATLSTHRGDARDSIYTRRELTDAATMDPYWNAAMVELRETGYLHNHMRMYWGKKVLEWTNTPEYAYRTLLYLNNRYLLDGRVPASFANVGWVFGLHDQAWPERRVFGKVRYMNAEGLRRKTDPDAYVNRVGKFTGLEIHGAL